MPEDTFYQIRAHMCVYSLTLADLEGVPANPTLEPNFMEKFIKNWVKLRKQTPCPAILDPPLSQC